MKVDKNLDFIDDLRVNEENQQYINNKLRKFSLKSLSSL